MKISNLYISRIVALYLKVNKFVNVTNNFNDDITTTYSKTALNKFMTDVLKRKGNTYYLHDRDSIYVETNIQNKKPDRMKRKTFELSFVLRKKM